MEAPTSAWERCRYENGTLHLSWTTTIPIGGANVPGFVGIFEASGKLATQFDVLVDLSQTLFALGTPRANDVALSIALYSMSDAEKVYHAQFNLCPGLGATELTVPSGRLVGGTVLQDPFNGNVFLVQAGGVAGLTWGVEATLCEVTFFLGGFQTSGIFISGIAHGVEL